MYQVKKDRAFYILLNCLNKLGCLPKRNESKITFLLRTISIRFVSSFPWWGVLLHLTMNIINKTDNHLNEDLANIITLTGAQMATILFICNHKKWLTLLQDIADCSVFGKPRNFESKERYGNLCIKIFLIYISAGMIMCSIVALIDIPHCNRLNEEEGLREICGTLLPFWLPFDVDHLSIRMTIFLTQIISSLLVFYATASVFVLPLSVIELIVSHIDHLKSLFNEIFEEEDHSLRSVKLGFCINYHNHILRMANDLSYLSKITLGHYSMISAVGIGAVGNHLIQEGTMAALLHLIAFLVQLFILCHCGQRLSDETTSLHESVYFSNWYLADPKMIKNVQLVLLRCEKPVLMESLPLGYLNYSLFVLILKSAYSYVTLLNEVI